MKTFLRTSIVLNNSSHDIQVHAHEPVATTVYEVLRDLKEDFVEKGRDTSWLEDPNASWTLERHGRRQLDPEKTLHDQGIYDGTRLYLVKNASQETYPFLDDDLTEAVAKGAERVPEWRYDMDGVQFAQQGLAVLGVVLSAAAVIGLGWAVRLPDYAHFATAGAFVIMALIAAALAAPLSTVKDRSLATSLAVAGYSTMAAGAFVAIPQEPGIWHMPVVASAVFVYGIVFRVFSKDLIEVHATVISAIIPVLITGVIALSVELFAPSYMYPTTVWSALIMFIALLMVVYSSQMSMPLGKIQLPTVHTNGEGIYGDDENLHEVNRRATGTEGEDGDAIRRRSSGREATESVINRDKQLISAHRYMIGLLTGSCGALIVSAAFLGYGVADMHKHYWITCAFALMTAVCLFDRGRTYRPADARRIIYISAPALVASYVIGLTLSDPQGNKWQIIATLGAVTVFTVIGSLWSLAQKTIRNPLTLHRLKMLDAATYFTLLPLLGALLDVWTLIRNR